MLHLLPRRFSCGQLFFLISAVQVQDQLMDHPVLPLGCSISRWWRQRLAFDRRLANTRCDKTRRSCINSNSHNSTESWDNLSHLTWCNASQPSVPFLECSSVLTKSLKELIRSWFNTHWFASHGTKQLISSTNSNQRCLPPLSSTFLSGIICWFYGYTF